MPSFPSHRDPQALFDFLQQQQAEQHSGLPPVEQWQPPLSGEMDMRIAADGTWYHQGSAIRRQAMVKLFSRILKREDEDYFLVTPVEKWRIRVEDAPFVVVDFRVERAGGDDYRDPASGQALVFNTQVEDEVVLGPDNPLWVREAETRTGSPRPYLRVRPGLDGLLHRNVYYRLVDLALQQAEAGKKAEKKADEKVGVWSLGHFFGLG
ncbi:DUF1285 domain-containing protein [Exilibacterium tricleocarpae]|uniref:DUF1285 domain-containing protein n=1 Tax=Exilibacterium tricleocarpae TaxID=2591008 RepID=A0A545TVL9_9GAMM|nr:DUF1285 domain-containing protein [Exilibacterium tricleocarpae]TQV81270.1 DUF1285 domain-containing protein [Exilibacterium tricleocarpae]